LIKQHRLNRKCALESGALNIGDARREDVYKNSAPVCRSQNGRLVHRLRTDFAGPNPRVIGPYFWVSDLSYRDCNLDILGAGYRVGCDDRLSDSRVEERQRRDYHNIDDLLMKSCLSPFLLMDKIFFLVKSALTLFL